MVDTWEIVATTMSSILLVDNGSTSCSSLEAALKSLGCEVSRMPHEKVSDVSGYRGIVLSGRARPSRSSNANNSRILLEALADGIPTLGICYGAEILATTFGGTLTRLASGEKEGRLITVVTENRLLTERSFIAQQSHSFQIARLSTELQRLARSSNNDNEAIKHAKAETYGVQFHPELSGEVGQRILSNFNRICG